VATTRFMRSPIHELQSRPNRAAFTEARTSRTWLSNPSLSPVQTALFTLEFEGKSGMAISRVVLLEVEGASISQKMSRTALGTIAPPGQAGSGDCNNETLADAR
jgi:hypothetical protein